MGVTIVENTVMDSSVEKVATDFIIKYRNKEQDKIVMSEL